MRFYATYLAQRLGQFLLVVFIGINLTYLITHRTPIDPVEQSIAAVTSFGNTSPEAIGAMRQSLRELYGLTGAPGEQYLAFWRRIITADFGPSLSAFPTPVSTLIARALPWTIGLLATATLLTWVLGNLLGGLAGYYQNKTSLKVLAIIAMGLHPVPYYIVAFVLLVMFGYLWPLLPIAGGKAMNLGDRLNLEIVLSILEHSILPALSLLLVGLGGWFLGMRSLVSNIVSEDYVVYAELAGVHPPPHPDLLRHAQCAAAPGHGPRPVAGCHLQRRHYYRTGVRLPRRWLTARLRRLCRGLRPGVGGGDGVDHRRIDGSADHRSPLSAARSPRADGLTPCSPRCAT